MRVKTILRYTDAKLNTEKFPGDTFDVPDSRGIVLIKAGYAEKVMAEESPKEPAKRGRPAKPKEI